jgi:hypothetical protein
MISCDEGSVLDIVLAAATMPHTAQSGARGKLGGELLEGAASSATRHFATRHPRERD